jgi:predicted nucleotidyltransferase
MDLSGVTELAPLTEVVRQVVRAAERAEARTFVTGAFARDLWLWYLHQIRTGRATEDMDFAVQCESWDHFEKISEKLLGAGFHRTGGNLERMFEEIPRLEEREDFAIDRAGAELLGVDLVKAVDREFVVALESFLEGECDPSGELRLARDMRRRNEEEARRLLDALLRGLASRVNGSVGES